MRMIIFALFVVFVGCSLMLPTLTGPYADEIELLERKLEYLKVKQALDLELKIVKAKLKKLSQDYSDVADTKLSTATTNASEAKQSEALTEVVEVPDGAVATDNSGSEVTHWVASDGHCSSNRQAFKEISINEVTGEFSLFNYFKNNPSA